MGNYFRNILSFHFFCVSNCYILSGFTVRIEEITRENDIILVHNHQKLDIIIFGNGMNTCSNVFLTQQIPNGSNLCFDNYSKSTEIVKLNPIHEFKSQFFISKLGKSGYFYFCLFCQQKWIHQGSERRRTIKTNSTIHIPLWLEIIGVILCFGLSGFFSGINMGLMTLQPSTLRFFKTAGNENEKKFAKRIYPLRKHGNILLCTILFGNVLANSTLTILLSKLIEHPALTVTVVTITVVIFGEIIPQAIGARNALYFSYYTIWITGFSMIVTFILSYPIGKLLDLIMGEEINQPYSKEKLKQIIKQQESLGLVYKDEMEIISGALTLTEKTVADVMTPISHAFMINYHAILDYKTMKEIVRNGYTRIPVYDVDKNNIKGVLNIKDLLFIDPQDNIPVSTICTFYNRQILIVPDDVKLPEILNEFKKGKAHLAFIEKIITDEGGDPYEKLIGLVTLEDVIEEIIQDEIVDETDLFYDNSLREKKITNRGITSEDLISGSNQQNLPPQLYKATVHYMSKSIHSFGEKFVSHSVLESLLQSKIVCNHFHSMEHPNFNEIISKGEYLTNAILLLQGNVSVVTSSEGLVFVGGPFIMFGENILKNINTYLKETKFKSNVLTDAKTINEKFRILSDYSVTSLMNLQYLSISASQYVLIRYLSDKKYLNKLNLLTSEVYAEEWEDFGEVFPTISLKLKPKIVK